MFIKIFLIFSVAFVASANNVIPAQTYPIYQQNGYMNPSTNQLNNIQSYLQGATFQNQQSQGNISPNSIKQALLSKLISNPSLQAVLDPSSRNYGLNSGVVQNKQIPVNPVNNYANVPSEYLRSNASYTRIDREPTSESTSTEKPKRRKSKPRRKQSEILNNEENPTKTKPSKSNNKRKTNTETGEKNNRNSKKNSRKSTTEVIQQDKEIKDDTNNNKPRKRKNKQKEQTTEAPIEEDEVKPNRNRRRRKKQKTKENIEPENAVSNKTKEIVENGDLDITHEGKNNENRQTRHSNQEVNDLLKSIPSPPKEMTNHFLSNVNQFNNPLMDNWFTNYENLYQSMLVNQPTMNDTRPKRRRKSRKNKQNIKNYSIRNNTSNSTAKTVAIDSTTTERVISLEESTHLNEDSNTTDIGLKFFEDENIKLSSNEIFGDGYNISEFEDRYDTGFYGGYIDDYYPLFTDSAAYNANNKEIILKNLNDNKYYYTTDKIETDPKKKYQKQNISEKLLMDYEKNKHSYDETERESIRNAYEGINDDLIRENLQFRSPPHLESPDFQTREIDKSELIPDVYFNTRNRFVGDKSSPFNTKSSYYDGLKRNEIKTQPKGVETVYAKSKVVSYGPVYSPTEDIISGASIDGPLIEYDLPINSFQDGGTTYIVAYSIDDPETAVQW